MLMPFKACLFKLEESFTQTSTELMIDPIVSFQKHQLVVSHLTDCLDRRGNKQLTAICAANIVIYLLGKGYYIWRNKQRDQAWNALSKDVSNNPARLIYQWSANPCVGANSLPRDYDGCWKQAQGFPFCSLSQTAFR